MSKIAVVFWSGSGNTEAMADAVVEGAKGKGAEVDVFGPDAFDADKAAAYDAIAFGCPAMGDEVLEEEDYQPMFDGVKKTIGAKKVGLFGSYGWGDGEWMRSWESDCKDSGITLVLDPVICNEAPDDEGLAACRTLGEALA